MMIKSKIIYRHIGDVLKINSSQEPRRVYYSENKFKCLLWKGVWVTFQGKKNLLQSYPHLENELDI